MGKLIPIHVQQKTQELLLGKKENVIKK